MVEIWAASGLANDIMAAVEQARNVGATDVRIPKSVGRTPDGKWHWNGDQVVVSPYGDEFPTELNILGEGPAGCTGEAGGFTDYVANTIIHNDMPQLNGKNPPTMFELGGMTHGFFRRKRITLGNLQLEATPPPTTGDEDLGAGVAIGFTQIPDWRAHHITLKNFSDIALSASANDGHSDVDVSQYGLVDHCVVINPYKMTPPPSGDWAWGYGFYTGGNANHDRWNPDIFPSLRGQYQWVRSAGIMYVEDCHFSYNRHCLDATDGGYMVSRHNLFDRPACTYTAASINNHGPAFSGCYGSESYNNKIIGAVGNVKPWDNTDSYYSIAVGLRGGRSLIYNNNFICGTPNQYNYFIIISQGDYTADRLEQRVLDSYIWNNTNTVGNSFGYIDPQNVENVNYFLRAPTFAYTAYPYPHPRASDGVLPTTHNLSVNSNINGIPFNVRRVA